VQRHGGSRDGDRVGGGVMVIWDMAQARDFIDKVRAVVQPAGWHVALTGSVFWRGESAKDLDLILFPHHKTGPLDLDGLRAALLTIPKFLPHVPVEQMHAYWRKIGSPDTKHVEVWLYRGCRRVDLMVMS
jgi:hypothetical protein